MPKLFPKRKRIGNEKKNSEPKSLGLAFYFGVLVTLIIIVSVAFKIVDVVKNSKLTGNTVFPQLWSKAERQIFFLSLQLKALLSFFHWGPNKCCKLKSLGIPADGYIQSQNTIDSSAKSTFLQAILHKRSVSTNLTIFDLLDWLFTRKEYPR